MNVTNTFLRVCNNNGEIYPPYYFQEDNNTWIDEEMEVVSMAIDPYVPEKVNAMFNNWVFTKSKYSFYAKKSTWEFVWCAKTAEEIAEKITHYYGR